MSAHTGTSAAEIRAQLGHPIIDADGHAIEVQPVLLDYLEAAGGPAVVDRYRAAPVKRQFRLRDTDPYQTIDSGSWVWPTRNTVDRATATFPRLYAERLDEFGIDFAIIYPSEGLFFPQLDDDEVRIAGCRAYNTYISEAYAEFSDRMTPAAIIPCNTPDEAVAELRHAVGELGMKAVVLRSYVKRDGGRLDFLALGSDYDYDPVWAECARLGVAATFHTSAVYGGRNQIPNYSYNHIGILAAGGEAIAKALFMGGVTQRFPELNFAFLEGGVAWGLNLLTDLASHWERRSATGIGDYDPANLDLGVFLDLAERYGDDKVAAHLDDLRAIFGSPQPEVAQRDNFERVHLDSKADFGPLYVDRYWFGVEADDPLAAVAFDPKLNPVGRPLSAVLGSDNAHWDVPDMALVLHEVWENVEDGRMTTADIERLCYTNAVHLHAGMNPKFFAGTRVEADVDRLLAAPAHS